MTLGLGGDLQQAGLALDLEKDLCGLARWTKGQLKLGSGLWATGTGSEGMAAGTDQVMPFPCCGQIFLGLFEDE